MYIRKKKNRSGTISIVVVSKASGKHKEIKCFGTVNTENEAQRLCDDAQNGFTLMVVSRNSTLMMTKGGNWKRPNM